MKVAVYSRYSTDLQDRTSIGGQIANCEALAAREGLSVVGYFQDEGRSGNDDNRVGYKALLSALKRGDFTGIVCDETSRITRNQSELHRLVAELKFRDQFLVTCDGIDTRSESSELILSVKAAIDQMEGRKIGYRTYRSLRERHRTGHSAGGRIYGYSSVQDGDYKRRVIDSDQATVILEIFERYAKGEGAKSIARDLNERGVPSPGSFWNNRKRRAAGWAHTTLLGSYAKAAGILRNPAYTGRVTWNKRAGKKVPGTGMRIQKRRPDAEWIEFQDESLRIVPDAMWTMVQSRLKTCRDAAHATNRAGRPARYLLSGLLVCSCCGGHYIIDNGKNYRCASQGNGRICNQRRWLKRYDVERELLVGIKEQFFAPGFVKWAAKRAQSLSKRNGTMSDHKARLREIERQITDVVDTIVAVGKSDALTQRLKKLESERKALQRQAEPAVSTMIPRFADRWDEIVSNLEKLPSRARAEELETARIAIREFIGEVSVTERDGRVYACPKVRAGAGFNHGAQDSLTELKPILVA